MVKKVMENRLIGNRRHIRALIVDRALLQHESRLLERSNTSFTTGHQQILEALLELVRKDDESEHCLVVVINCFLMKYPSSGIRRWNLNSRHPG